MAMFARRVLQTMLDHLAAHLPLEARKKLARELNQQSRSALGFEWETALLFGFSHIGKIEYEAPSLRGPRPDITFVEHSDTPVRFTADITTVSDEGLEEENPAMRLSMALTRLKHRYTLPGSTHYSVKGEATGPHFRDRKMRLKLPSGHQVEKLLEKHVGPMFKRIRQENLATASVEINEHGMEVSIRYDANQRYGAGSYPSYTAAYSLKRNPVYTALNAKLGQLKKLASTDPLGIFLCDGDCALLKNTRNHFAAVSIDQVMQEFFRKNSSVSFVAVLFFPPSSSVTFAGIVKDLRITGRVYVNARAKAPMDETALLNVINRSLAHWSAPCATVHDALYWIANGDANQGMPVHFLSHGGSLMSQSLKVSARKIQEMLAGKMTPEQFCNEYARPDSPFEIRS